MVCLAFKKTKKTLNRRRGVVREGATGKLTREEGEDVLTVCVPECRSFPGCRCGRPFWALSRAAPNGASSVDRPHDCHRGIGLNVCLGPSAARMTKELPSSPAPHSFLCQGKEIAHRARSLLGARS